MAGAIVVEINQESVSFLVHQYVVFIEVAMACRDCRRGRKRSFSLVRFSPQSEMKRVRQAETAVAKYHQQTIFAHQSEVALGWVVFLVEEPREHIRQLFYVCGLAKIQVVFSS